MRNWQKQKELADYNITTATTPVNPVNFKRIEDKDVDQSVDEGGVSLIGNKDMKLDRNVYLETCISKRDE